MLKADDNEEVSLRPLSLRPGTAAKNPFASFGKGAGAAFRDKVRLASGWYCTAASALICYHSALDMLGATAVPVTTFHNRIALLN